MTRKPVPTDVLARVGVTETERYAIRKRFLEDTYFAARLLSASLGMKLDLGRFHAEMCEFIDWREHKRRALFAPRGHLKTTLVRAWEIQQAMRDPDVRILHVMSTSELAEQSGRTFDGIFRESAILRWLFPERIPDFSDKTIVWNINQKTIPRTRVSGDPTFRFCGTGTKVTGTHWDIIILDDFIEEDAARSEVVMEAACDWQRNCEPLLEDPNESQLLVLGTRWSLNDWYGQMMGAERQKTEKKVFQAEGDPRYVVMKRRIIEDGVPVWPERFPMEAIAQLKQSLSMRGKAQFFYLQYMNDPVDEGACAFPRDMIRYYEWNERGDKLILSKPDGKTVVIPFSSLTLTMTVDPTSTAKSSSDNAAICVMGTHPHGYRVNVYSWEGKATAGMLVRKIFGVVKGFRDMGREIYRVAIEKVGAQENLYDYIDDMQKATGTFIPMYKNIKTSHRKNSLDDRILGMVPVVAAGVYYTHRHFMSANAEMETWPNGGHPDWLSAFSYQPQIWPSPETFAEPVEWLDGATTAYDDPEDDEPAPTTERRSGYGG